MKRLSASQKATPKQSRPALFVPAKITPPRLGACYLRKGLFQKLDQYGHKPAMWICGPAGSGKTMLAASYLQERRITYLWYQVDARDADPATLFYYLGLAAKHHSPGRRKSLPLFTPEYLLGMSAFARNFFEALFKQLKPPFALVLDNYQQVAEEALLHQVVDDLLAVVPQGGQVILISRSQPPQALGRMQVHQQMVLLDWHHLQLDVDDVQALSGVIQKAPLALSEAKAVHAATMGWAAGVVLMLAQPQTDAKSIDEKALAAPEMVFDYFAAEILAELDDSTRDFLIKTAFLSQVGASMATSLTGHKQSSRILADLARKNYFTLQCHSRPQKLYQYHPLFRHFLLQQAEQRLTTEQINTLRVAAADLLLDAQRYEEAVEYLHQTQNWNRLVAIILQMASTLMVQGRNLTLLKWIDYVPERILDREPWLLYWRGVVKVNFSPEKGRKIIEQVFEQFEKQQDVTGMLKSWAYLVDSIIFEWNLYDPLDKWIDKLTEISNRTIQFENVSLEAAVAGAMLAACYCRQPDHPDKSHWEARVHNLFSRIEDNDQKIRLGIELLFNAVFMGEFNDARSLIKEWSGFVSQNKSIAPITRIRWSYIKSLYEWLAGELDACAKTVTNVLQFADASGVHVMDNYIIATGTNASIALGDPEMVQYYFEKVQTRDGPMGANEKVVALFLESCWAMTLGKTDRALNIAEQASRMATKPGFPFTEAMINIGYGQLLNETGHYDKGGKILEEVLAAGERMDSKYILFGALAYLADHAIATQNEAKGLDLLNRALLLGKKEGYYNLHWFHPDVVGALFVKALMAGIEVEYVQAFIQKRKLIPKTESMAVEHWPWPLRIYTLGHFDLEVNDQVLKTQHRGQNKPLALLKAVIAFGGRQVREEQLWEALWPDAEGDAAHVAFTTTLHRLRKLIGHEQAITLQGRQVSLDPHHCWVDTWSLETLLCQPLAIDGAPKADSVNLPHHAEQIFHLYQGHFLAGENAPWLLGIRERLRTHVLRQINAIAHQCQAQQLGPAAIAIYEHGLGVDPLIESFYLGLMQCFIKMERYADALAAYERCRKILGEVLKVRPCTDIEILRQQLRR